MSKKLTNVKVEQHSSRYSLTVWANAGQKCLIELVDGIVNVSEYNTRYIVNVDHRYDVQTVIDDIIARLS